MLRFRTFSAFAILVSTIILCTSFKKPKPEEASGHVFSMSCKVTSCNGALSDKNKREEFALWCKDNHITKLWLESFRHGETVPTSLLKKERNFFRRKGMEVCGMITPTRLNAPSDNAEAPIETCWSDPAARKKLSKEIQRAARIFDTIIIDDFLFLEHGDECLSCARDKASKGIGDWEEYRRALLLDVCREDIIASARKVNPEIRMIIKYPCWWRDWEKKGYSPLEQAELFGECWIGTETRDANPDPLQACWIVGYTQKLTGGRCSGGWYDALDSTPQKFIEQAYYTILGGAKESLIHCYDYIISDNPGLTPYGEKSGNQASCKAIFEERSDELFRLAKKLEGAEVIGFERFGDGTSLHTFRKDGQQFQLVFTQQGCNPCHAESDGNGHSFNIDGITVLDLNGTWHQMGRQYGILARTQMNDVLEYLDCRIGLDSAKIREAAGIADKLYANYSDSLKSFFDGVSRTSGIPLERLKLCNAVEYVEGVFLCSAMAAWDDYGAGKLVFGRNYDAVSYREIDRDVVVTVYHPSDGNAVATVGYAGEIYCVNGMNDKGLFVELNNGMPSAGSEIHWELCPGTTSLFEMLFSAESLDDVDSFFKNTRSPLSTIIGVADKREARSYEWCFDGVRRGDEVTPDGLMISTNHYVNFDWPFDTPSDEISWDSITRYGNMVCKAEKFKGSIGVEEMKEIMSASLEDGGPKHLPTRYQMVVVPEDMLLYINIPSNGRWVELNMKALF